MNIVVTGGAGFVGSHLVRQLVQTSNSIRVIEKPGAAVHHLPHSVDVAFADIRDRAALRSALAGATQVYHLAANPQLWTYPRSQFHEVNYLGTVHVLEESLNAGAKRILHCSTESILTRARQTTPISEEQTITSADVIGPYCRSKFLAEEFALGLGKQGAPIVVVNPTLPVGPGDLGKSPPTQMMLDFCLGKRSIYLDAELNFMDVRDIARGMVAAMDRGHAGRRYLLGAENWSVKNVFDFLAEETGLPKSRWAVPYPVALCVAYVSEAYADWWSHRIPAATVTGVKLTRRRMHFDASRSLAELELVPQSIAASIRETVAWFRHQGWIPSRVSR